MSHSLLGYLGEHKPDLERRAYLKSLGLPTSQIDLPQDGGSLMNTDGRVLTVPPAAKTRITPSGNATHDWMQSVKGEPGVGSNRAFDQPGQGQSLVSPLMWIPGVLKSQGAWTTAMRDTIHGPVMAVQPGVTLIKSDLLQNVKEGPTPEEQLKLKDQLITELERALTKQKLVVDKVVHKTKKHAREFSKMMERASTEQRKRNEEKLRDTVGGMQDRMQKLRDNLRTTKKASAARVKTAYAQDNFLSQYSKIMTTVQAKAQAIADVDHTSLKNQVSALKRGMLRDDAYKKALLERTEISEGAAEKRWLEAERKIPQLERLINDAHARAVQVKMFQQEKNQRQQREFERLNTLLRREQEARAQAEQHVAVMARQIANSSMRASSPKQSGLFFGGSSKSPPSPHSGSPGPVRLHTPSHSDKKKRGGFT